MQKLTPEGNQIVNDLSQRYGFSPDAITHMMFAVLNGNGSMAQFSHPEFGGSGQWMQGGMMMLGDMFNTGLKHQVDSLCNEISRILGNQPGLFRSGSFQSQSQSGSGQQNQMSGVPQGQSSLFVPDPRDNWWPAELGAPNSTGSQNNVRYAYFAGGRRLAVETGGDVWVYDTLDHQIGGFSQQQGMGSSIVFTSQYGTVNLGTLPVVSRNGQPLSVDKAVDPVPPGASPVATSPTATSPTATPAATGADSHSSILDAIARLGELKEKGILTDEEFSSKKAELLSRL